MSHPKPLIDTTEAYLRIIYELKEEGTFALRARIAERLEQSGPTVSQSVSRMQRNGLVQLAEDRQLHLTEQGRCEAIRVTRKHRLAERLLLDVLGVPWPDVYNEACRWQHVISTAAERRIATLLDTPLTCPHGCPIPGLVELGLSAQPPRNNFDKLVTLTASARDALDGVDTVVSVDRISERLQPDAQVMRQLLLAQVRPGRDVHVRVPAPGFAAGPTAEIEVWTEASRIWLEPAVSDHILVWPAGSARS